MYSATTILAATNQRKQIFPFIVHQVSSFSPMVFLLACVFHQLSPHFLSVWSDVGLPVSCQLSQPLLCVRAKVGSERMCVPHGARLRNSSRLPKTIPCCVHMAFNNYSVVLFFFILLNVFHIGALLKQHTSENIFHLEPWNFHS